MLNSTSERGKIWVRTATRRYSPGTRARRERGARGRTALKRGRVTMLAAVRPEAPAPYAFSSWTAALSTPDAPPAATAPLRPIRWRLLAGSKGKVLDADAEEFGQAAPNLLARAE